MDQATAILQSLADGNPEPSMGSEYMGAQRYLLKAARVIAERDAGEVAHGSNESDFGATRLVAD